MSACRINYNLSNQYGCRNVFLFRSRMQNICSIIYVSNNTDVTLPILSCIINYKRLIICNILLSDVLLPNCRNLHFIGNRWKCASCNFLNSIKCNFNGLYIFIVVQRLQQCHNSYNNCFTVMRLTDTHPTTFHVAQNCWSSPFYLIMHYEFHRNTKNEKSIM